MIPFNSFAAPIYLPLNLKFLYESTVIHSLSFFPHSHHCPLLSHITALPSVTSLPSPPLPHITVLPSLIRISILEGVYVQIILTATEETSATSVFVGTNPQDLITEDWDIADWSASNGLLVEGLVDRLSKTLAYYMTLTS